MKALYGTALGGIAIAGIAFFAGLNAVDKEASSQNSGALASIDQENPLFAEAVRSVLLKNPEMVEEAQTLLAAQRQAAEEESRKAVLADLGEQLNDPALPVLGNPDAPYTIVEFFDYNCGYCKRAMDDMEAVLAVADDVKFVMKEFPILGPQSLEAHQISAAVQGLKPEAYAAFHKRLLSFEGSADGVTATTVAVSLGVSEEDIAQYLQRPDANKLFADSYGLAEKLSISGTPSYIIGDEVIFGAEGAEAMLARIERMRETAQN